MAGADSGGAAGGQFVQGQGAGGDAGGRQQQQQQQSAAAEAATGAPLRHANRAVFTAANEGALACAMAHCPTCIYEVTFPGAGTLGLNLRPVLLLRGARAGPLAAPRICVEVKDVQQQFLTTVIQPRDLIVAVNGRVLGGAAFTFEKAIAMLSTAPPPRTLRFARIPALDPLEVELSTRVTPCATFDIQLPPSPSDMPRLVTAQIDPGAPAFFILNPPTRGLVPLPKRARRAARA
ncbi:hypothetical protein JKP88DRAFT_254199 [Tribonema minus]|uniref:PDZ domain-containing protein n=1 Tax=Tribonema minus TaxID=303371 RepID=A0A835Z599_9STRA|nr:hypothetical protein JKP88DRAFT_254199 [Tribonema minus]